MAFGTSWYSRSGIVFALVGLAVVVLSVIQSFGGISVFNTSPFATGLLLIGIGVLLWLSARGRAEREAIEAARHDEPESSDASPSTTTRRNLDDDGK